MTTTDLLFHDVKDRFRLDRKEGLARFLQTTLHEPERHTPASYDALGATGKRAYDARRRAFRPSSITIDTPDLLEARLLLAQCINGNASPDCDRGGLILTGEPTVGKTTAAKALMHYVHSRYTRQFPDFADHGHIPIVFIEVPSGCTGRNLMCAFAEFFGMTVARSDTMHTLRHRVVDMLEQVGTQLVIVDELHNLAASTAGNGESVDILRSLHRDVFATFVYAGLHLDTVELLSGARGRQISARFAMMQMKRFHASDEIDKNTWRAIIEQFEQALPLLKHKQGSLAQLSDYLLERTNGSFGTLGKLIDHATIAAIGTTEAITRPLLDKQRVDYSAEKSRAETVARKNLGRTAAARVTGGAK